MVESNAPKPMAIEWIHETVLSLLPIDGTGKRILDAAAGQGALTWELSKRSYDVTPVDINPENFKAKETCMKWDLNEELPFDSGSFDYVASVETLEHLWNPFGFIRSIHRVLKVDGIFVFTTPNVLSIFSRVLFLSSGRFAWFQPVDYHDNRHIHPLPLWQIQQTLDAMGVKFKVEAVTFNQFHFPFIGLRSRRKFLLKPATGQILIVKMRRLA